MLRNTFRLIATTTVQPQVTRRFTYKAIRRIISGKPSITESTIFNPQVNIKCLSTNIPHLQKEPCFIKADGTRIKATGKEGDSLLDVIVNNHIDLEGFGACEGTLTCSTCHLIFSESDFAKLRGSSSEKSEFLSRMANEHRVDVIAGP